MSVISKRALPTVATRKPRCRAASCGRAKCFMVGRWRRSSSSSIRWWPTGKKRPAPWATTRLWPSSRINIAGLHHYFRQHFAQVTNPPIDSLRESAVMTLTTRLGNLGNILDEDESQLDFLKLPSPVLSNGEFASLRRTMGDRRSYRYRLQLRYRRRRKRACRSVGAYSGRGRGCRARRVSHIVLSDRAVGEQRRRCR